MLKMKETRFIDTSILVEILGVPDKCSDSDKFRKELVEFYKKPNATLIMPISVLIETGNHVNHIKDGSRKTEVLDKFYDILNMFLTNSSPWSFYGYNFTVDDTRRIIEHYKVVVYSKVGIGDVFILDAYNQYVEQLKANKKQNHLISIWTLDEHLSSYSQKI